jgi:ABC-type multidrug transport system fused ATPase/permease subunit
LHRHSADLGKTILSEVGQVINDVLMPCMEIVAHGIVALFLITLLVVVDPVLAVAVLTVLGGVYFIVYLLVRGYLSRIGADRVASNRERFQIAQEALGGIKEVKIFGREKAFLDRFRGPSLRFARHKVNSHVAGMVPSFALQIVAFGGMLLLILYLLKTTGDLSRALPLVAVYALAGNRLLPALQMVYQSMTRLRYGMPAMESLRQDLLNIDENWSKESTPPIEALVPRRMISLNSVSFTYPGGHKPALRNICLDFPVETTVGLVGVTGSGKTTAVDLVLGLLYPDQGNLLVDGIAITADTIKKWQKSLGYVPQHIYLADDTIAANIAFGIPPDAIDLGAVERAARIAELHTFVTNELPDGYMTMVGERGVRLSGGQRQRIGIARALYHDPAVIVFDEATSALDNLTEQAVMTAVHNLGGVKTIILIAHRLLTVRKCDIIYILHQGDVVGKGSYEHHLATNEQFCAMAGLAHPR